MAPPAAVPSWAGFNEALFREIKARAVALPKLPPAGAKIIASLTVIGGRQFFDRMDLVRQLVILTIEHS